MVLAVRDEQQLLEIHRSLEGRSVAHVLVREPDLASSATAIGVGIVDSGPGLRRVRKVLSSLPLYGRDEDDEVRCGHCQSPAWHSFRHADWICTRTGRLVSACENKESLVIGKDVS